MVTAITQGIKISVVTDYQEAYSRPEQEMYTFAYQITIENLSDYAIQLMRRQWFIFDSVNERREVEGEGVVGVQPVIAPGDSYTYVSGCNLTTDMGAMSGHYLMHRAVDEAEFTVEIPEFQLIAPYRLN